MKIKIKKLYTSPLLFFFLVIPFFIPDSIYALEEFSRYFILISLWEYISVISIFCLELSTIKKNKIFFDIYEYNAYRILVLLLVQPLIFGTISLSSIYNTVKILMIVSFLIKCFIYDHDCTLKRLFFLLFTLSLFNAISVWIFPSGMYIDANWQNYFLGYKNGLATVLFPAMCFGLLYSFYYKKYLLTTICFISCGYSLFMTYSSTAIVGFLIFIIVLVLCRFPIIRKYILSWKNIAFIVFISFVFINVMQGAFNLLSMVAGAFNKDLTFSGRVDLWEAAINSFIHYPIFGVGEDRIYLRNLFTLHVQELYFSHNEFMDVAVRYGIIGFLLYGKILKKTIAISRRSIDIMNQLLPYFSSMWIMMLFESYSNYPFYYLYFVLLLYPRVAKVENQKRIEY